MESENRDLVHGKYPARRAWSPGGLRLLTRGLALENRAILLPWGARLAQLVQDGRPDQQVTRPAWRELLWSDITLLDGLRAPRVQVVMYPYGWFDCAWAWLHVSAAPGPAEASFEHAREHLARRLGQPASPSCEHAARMAAWVQPGWRADLLLSHGEPFEGFEWACLLHVARSA